MKTALSALTLCLVLLLAAAFPFERKGGAQTAAAKEKRAQYAARDDVNIIAHGLLQLGQNLKEHVDKTKVQMRDMFTKLKVFNRTAAELGRESQKQRSEGETLRARALETEQREGQLLNITAELKEKAEEIQQERRTMSERLSRLEQRVDRMLQGHRNSSNAGNIQLLLEAQNRRIDDLVEHIRLQQDKLDKQNTRIRTLQSQLSSQRPNPLSSTDDLLQSSVEEQRDTPLGMSNSGPQGPVSC